MLNCLRAACLLVICSIGHAHAQQPELIVNAENPAQNLTRNTARAMFSMRLQQWADGTPVTVFVLADNHPVHQQFCREKLALFPHQLRRSWDRYVYSGIGVAPYEVNNEVEMLERIAATPGSIGYTSKEIAHEAIRSIPVK